MHTLFRNSTKPLIELMGLPNSPNTQILNIIAVLHEIPAPAPQLLTHKRSLNSNRFTFPRQRTQTTPTSTPTIHFRRNYLEKTSVNSVRRNIQCSDLDPVKGRHKVSGNLCHVADYPNSFATARR
jgi:hypothetical protein